MEIVLSPVRLVFSVGFPADAVAGIPIAKTNEVAYGDPRRLGTQTGISWPSNPSLRKQSFVK